MCVGNWVYILVVLFECFIKFLKFLNKGGEKVKENF